MDDASAQEVVVVTGVGVLAPIGIGLDAFWAAIAAGRSALHALDDPRAAPELRHHFVGALPPPWAGCGFSRVDLERDPCVDVALAAAREAVASSALAGAYEASRLALVVGTTAAGLWSRSRYEATPRELADRRHALLQQSRAHVQTAIVADALGIDGPRLTLSTACTSSTHAIGVARDLLLEGHADAAVAGGVDLLVDELLAGFHAMNALAAAPCAPFSHPIGMNVGEGACFFVLERRRTACARGRRPWCSILGAASSADAHHPTAPSPGGVGMARAMRAALADAGLGPTAIGYVNAHGTGTEQNDAAESAAIRAVFGDAPPPISSTKSYFGHAMGAAGALELAATVCALEHGMVPPTLRFGAPRNGAPTDVVGRDRPRPHAYTHALKFNAGFGGVNAALVIGPPGAGPPLRSALGEVVIVGCGVTGGAAPGDPDMDAVSNLLTTAVAGALADAAIEVDATTRDRIGLVIGANRLPWDSADEFWRSIRARGAARASPRAFARIVMNAAAGAASRELEITGPMTVSAEGIGAGLRAVALAVASLRRRRDADVLVAGSVFELGSGMRDELAYRGRRGVAPWAPATEGGACLALTTSRHALAAALRVRARVAAVAVGGPGRLASAVREAFGRCGSLPITAVHGPLDPPDVAALFDALGPDAPPRQVFRDPRVKHGANESSDALALAAWVSDVEDRGAAAAVFVADDRSSGAVALVVERMPSALGFESHRRRV